MKLRRACILDEGERYVFKSYTPGQYDWEPEPEASDFDPCRILKSTRDGVLAVSEDSDTVTLYPWHVVLWCDWEDL